MKKWLMVVAALMFCVGAFASEGWLTDFEKAKQQAKEQNKHILIDFSGSDWCGWCIRLDKEVFKQKEFQEYAKDNLILMLADSPRDTSGQSAEVQKQNKKLKKQFGIRGFPTVFILDPSGKVVAKTGYREGGPKAYVKHIKQLIADGSKAKKAE